MLTNISFTRTKKFHHLSLRKPYRIFFYFYLKRNAFIWLIEHYLRIISSSLYIIVVCHNHTFFIANIATKVRFCFVITKDLRENLH